MRQEASALQGFTTSSANGQPLAAEALRHEVQLCILICLTTPSHPIFSVIFAKGEATANNFTLLPKHTIISLTRSEF